MTHLRMTALPTVMVCEQACRDGGQHQLLILLDSFHWFQRWEDAMALPKDHELSSLFFSQIRDVVLRPDVAHYKEEKDRLTKLLRRVPQHYQILSGVRRVIPQVGVTHAAVHTAPGNIAFYLFDLVVMVVVCFHDSLQNLHRPSSRSFACGRIGIFGSSWQGQLMRPAWRVLKEVRP
jgi:hypothetical protein